MVIDKFFVFILISALSVFPKEAVAIPLKPNVGLDGRKPEILTEFEVLILTLPLKPSDKLRIPSCPPDSIIKSLLVILISIASPTKF